MIDDYLDEYHVQQELAEANFYDVEIGDGSPLTNIFDSGFNGARSEMYRAQVHPDMFPDEKPMRIENWSQQDREMYVGGDADYYR